MHTDRHTRHTKYIHIYYKHSSTRTLIQAILISLSLLKYSKQFSSLILLSGQDVLH